MKRHLIYKTLFSRLIGTFSIIIIPIYILGMVMNLLAMNAVKTEITNSMSTQVSYYLNNLENEFGSIKILQYDCLSDENLNKLAILWEMMGTYERQQSMIQLQKRLLTIRNSSPYIKDVTAHIAPIQKSISANDGIVNLRRTEFEEVRINDNRKGVQLLVFEDELYMTTFSNGLYGNSSSMFSIIIQFNKNKFIETLSLLNVNTNSGMIFIQNSGNDAMVFPTDTGIVIPLELIDTGLTEREKNTIKTIKYNDDTYYVVLSESNYLNANLIKYVPEQFVMKPLQQIYVWFWIFSITSVLIFIIYSLSTYKYIHEPMTKLVKAFKRVEKGNMDVVINHDVNGEFEYIYRRFNDMVTKIGVLIDQVYKQKIMTQRAELKHLQSQINPHFLYNSFFLINTMARVGDENLVLFTKRLGEYFRFVTQNGRDVITLSEEFKHATVYMEIQNMRFSKRLKLMISNLPERYASVKVPRLILQPIIENAFEHAIEKKKVGVLSVSFCEEDEGLSIIVEDNGDGLDEKTMNTLNDLTIIHNEEDEISGLKNIHRRIRLVFGDQSGLYFEKSDFGGLKVLLKIKNNQAVSEELE